MSRNTLTHCAQMGFEAVLIAVTLGGLVVLAITGLTGVR